ncbi:hypothetical protein [uncultured Jatrophihabitans sp.]|uniref:hypothetical protein n=1 Tax=uncultured Jatrophihabitans sp. TaxID=1610747 RepID=UPI0035CC39A6
MNRRDVPEGGRLDNGLRAPAYVALTEVAAEVGHDLLAALGRARIAAYLIPAAAADRRRLYVSADERVDARTIVAAAIRGLGATGDATVHPAGDSAGLSAADPLAGIDTARAFDELVADWHVDTVAAVRDAERELSREDADWRGRLNKPVASDEVWLDEDHYVPPPPPPLPRLAGPTIIAMTVLVLSILVLGLGGQIGLANDLTLVLGVGGLVVAAGILFSRVREHHRDEDDDGAAI